jgi:seryl-tRNA synthetase
MRIDYAKRMITHIRQCGLGFIDGQRYPYPILFRELEEKVVIDDNFGDLAGEAEEERKRALSTLRAAQVADAERAQLEQEKAELAAEKQRLADQIAQKAAEEAAARAKADQEAADAEAKLKLEIIAAENAQKAAELAAEGDAITAEAAAVGADLTRTMISEIVEDIVQAYGSDMDKVRAEAIAWALVNGEIRHVIYAEPSA